MLLQMLSHHIENTAKDVGLHINALKTEHINLNQQGLIKTSDVKIKAMESFTYLGSQINSTLKDMKIRISKAWTALNKLELICKSNLSDNLKHNFFRAIVESILMYGVTAWTLTKTFESKLDDIHTQLMLRAALNLSWRQHATKQELYGPIPITSILCKPRMCFYRTLLGEQSKS